MAEGVGHGEEKTDEIDEIGEINHDLLHYSKLRVPSINTVLAKTMGGKSILVGELLVHFARIFAEPIDRLTLVYSPEQTTDYDRLVGRLSSSIEVIRRTELRPEFLSPEKLKSSKDNSNNVLFLDDQVGF